MDGEGSVVAVVDSEPGAPLNVWFDPIPNGIDDELAKSVTVDRRPVFFVSDQARLGRCS